MKIIDFQALANISEKFTTLHRVSLVLYSGSSVSLHFSMYLPAI